MRLLRTGEAGSAALELAISHALLTRVSKGELPSTLRVYRPRATVAFGKLDRLSPGYEAAVPPLATTATSPSCGSPAVTPRPTTRTRSGSTSCGRWTIPPPAPTTASPTRGSGSRARCARLGVDARVGEVPGEYCPGAYSVNARGRVKLIGTAQRLVRGAALLGASVVVGDGAASAPSCATSTPPSSSSGTSPPRARSTRRSRASHSPPSRPRSSRPTATSSRRTWTRTPSPWPTGSRSQRAP